MNDIAQVFDVNVTRRQSYGQDLYDPANELAQLAADLAGTKTLTIYAIERLKRFGCRVQVIAETETL
jgi:hypothetical protein